MENFLFDNLAEALKEKEVPFPKNMVSSNHFEADSELTILKPRMLMDIPPVAPSDIDYIGHNRGRCVRWHTRASVSMADLIGRELDDNFIFPLTDYLRFRGTQLQYKVTCLNPDKEGATQAKPGKIYREILIKW